MLRNQTNFPSDVPFRVHGHTPKGKDVEGSYNSLRELRKKFPAGNYFVAADEERKGYFIGERITHGGSVIYKSIALIPNPRPSANHRASA